MTPDEASRRIQSLFEFHEAIGRVAELAPPVHPDSFGADVSRAGPTAGRQRDLADAQARVDRLAMKAGRAFDAASVWVDHKPPGTWQTQRVNPALLWQVCFERDSWFPLGMLEQLINRAIGRLEDLRDDPPVEQRSLSLERFSFSTWVAALLYTALGGFIAAGLAYWIGWVG